MTSTKTTPIDHPGSYIKEEMEARGWIQRDLAFVLGCNEQALNAILSGKRGISPEMAKALGDAFDVPAEFFANLQQAYDMAQATNPYAGVAARGKIQSIFPVREMIQRRWLAETAEASILQAQLARFFESDSVETIPYMPHAAKRRYEDREIPPAELAWLFRVRQIARAVAVPSYSEKKLREAIRQFESLLLAPEEARYVPKLLSECGVKFVVVEKLPKASIDGVCFWLDDSPVIGMSTQRDKIDNFWFVLRHECEHVLRRDGREDEVIDFSLTGEDASATNEAMPEQERVANAAAADFCVPTTKMTTFIDRKKPFYSERDIVAFAKVQKRHPGIVIGQFQNRTERWDYLTRYLVKVRQFVVPYAISDGWGKVAPVSL
jgi:HTH-type transcriptional regulator/antitoxin HigA